MLAAFTLSGERASANSTVHIETAIRSLPDAELKKCLIELHKSKGWKTLSEVQEIKCHSKNIRTVSGLEAFKQLQVLSLHNNDLQDFNCNLFAEIRILNLAKNNIETLHCDKLIHLEKLYIFANQLTNLQLTQLEKLETLKANNNLIEVFQHQALKALNKIYLFNNKMESMEINGLPSLKYMDVRENPMPDELYEEMDKLSGVTVLHDGNAEDWN